MPDGSFFIQWLLLLPLLLGINLMAALPGRSDLKQVWRVALRAFMSWVVGLIGISVVLYFVMDWVIAGTPWW